MKVFSGVRRGDLRWELRHGRLLERIVDLDVVAVELLIAEVIGDEPTLLAPGAVLVTDRGLTFA